MSGRASDRRKTQDHWGLRAKREGYAARSVYKLSEIDDRLRVLPRGGGRVLDLGCAPGSWSQYVHRKRRGTRLVGVDLTAVAEYPGTLLVGSALEISEDALRQALGGPADLVMSDMAPRTTGNRLGDHVRQVELARMALTRAAAVLRLGGHFVVKVFDGEEAHGFTMDMRALFGKVKRVRPKACRKQTREFYLVGLGRSASQ